MDNSRTNVYVNVYIYVYVNVYSIFFEGNIKIFVTNSVGVCFQTGVQLNEILSEFSPISEIVQSLS